MEKNNQGAGGAANWHVVFTRYQHEKSVARVLSNKNHEVYLPLYSAVRQWQDRTKHLWFPLFPGYVFIRERPGWQLEILTTPGILQIVGWGGRPAVVPQFQLEAVRQIVQSGLAVETHLYLRRGDRVRVTSGPLAGLEGILTRKKGVTRLVVSLDLLGRSAAVELDGMNVERLGFVPAVPFPEPASAPV